MRISWLHCFTETVNDSKEMSPGQHHPREVRCPSVFHSNSTGAKGTTGNTLPKDGDVTIPRHKLEETPLTRADFQCQACCADPTIPVVSRTRSSTVNNPTPPGSTGGLTCPIHSEVPAPEPQIQPAVRKWNTAPQTSVLWH